MDYKKKIQEKGLRKDWIAKKLGISKTLFSFYINGNRSVPENIEKKLKEILG